MVLINTIHYLLWMEGSKTSTLFVVSVLDQIRKPRRFYFSLSKHSTFKNPATFVSRRSPASCTSSLWLDARNIFSELFITTSKCDNTCLLLLFAQFAHCAHCHVEMTASRHSALTSSWIVTEASNATLLSLNQAFVEQIVVARPSSHRFHYVSHSSLFVPDWLLFNSDHSLTDAVFDFLSWHHDAWKRHLV